MQSEVNPNANFSSTMPNPCPIPPYTIFPTQCVLFVRYLQAFAKAVIVTPSWTHLERYQTSPRKRPPLPGPRLGTPSSGRTPRIRDEPRNKRGVRAKTKQRAVQPRLDRAPVAVAGRRAEPIERLVRRDIDERVDGLHAYDGVVVREEGTEAVQPPRENERRYEIPPLPVLHVQEAQVRNLLSECFMSAWQDIFDGGGKARATDRPSEIFVRTKQGTL